jgi:hypothetical protein
LIEVTSNRGVNMTPIQSIRKFCSECAGRIDGVAHCGGDRCRNGGCNKNGVCLFYPHPMGKGRPSVKLIRKICLW